MNQIKLAEINLYPIKSLRGISLESSTVEQRGLQFDRRWMVVDENNELLTQREFPKMAVISAQVEAEGLSLYAKGFNPLFIPFAPVEDERIKVRVWDDYCDAVVFDKTVNDWFSEVLQTNCRLVFMPDDTKRSVESKYAVAPSDIVSFADAYPFLLISEGSLADLNERLENPVPMNRFRPNLVASGAEAFAEDGWRRVRIGETIFRVVKPCARCVLTTVDQVQGDFDGKEPLKTLASYRTVKTPSANKVLFGQNLIAENAGGTVRVGDAIEVLE